MMMTMTTRTATEESATSRVAPYGRFGTELRWEPRVLVVDDDEISRLAAVGLLQRLGLTVDIAADGGEALEMSARWPYVAIFMDCGMPGVDGYTTARTLRDRAGKNWHALVIAQTSHLRSVSMASGMDHHLTKPLQFDVLRADCLGLGLIAPEGVGPSPVDALVGLDTPLLNPSVFSDTTGDGRLRRANAATALTKETTATLPALWRAINSGDSPALERLAGALRDRATAVGTERVAELCDHLCQAAVNHPTPADIELQLRGVLVDTDAAIAAYVDGVAVADSAAQPADASDLNATDPPPVGPTRIAIGDHDPLDEEGLKRLLENFGSARLLADLVDLFGSETPKRLRELRRAIAAGDTAAVGALAHELKGGCLTLAAVDMAGLCSELEASAAKGSLEGAAPLAERIETAFESAYDALSAIAADRDS
jgi:CheY-like chemotaxis protein